MPKGSTDMTGNPLYEDPDRLYAIMDDGTLVVIQYYVFGHVFKDIALFAPGVKLD